MKKYFAILILLPFWLSSYAQIFPNKYYVQFTDKDNSPYSISAPEEYLSQRAIERRLVQGIPIDLRDLPVNPQYLEGVMKAGAEIINPTKWLNGVTVYASDPAIIEAIELLPYVQGSLKAVNSPSAETFVNKFFTNTNERIAPAVSPKGSSGSDVYGPAFDQIQQVNGVQVHENGFRGKGIIIGVLDSGFDNADLLPVFDSLWDSGRILASYDFVADADLSYSTHFHGTGVLSILAANLPGTMVGTAPDASYILVRTEDHITEFIIEEYNWVSGAEFADSAGADILSTSLGYYAFNDPSQDHVYADLDGNTTPITRGADIAAGKGLAVLNSAGNTGQQAWYYITPPADGDSVFTIGGVDSQGNPYVDCGHGPTSDGRLKPNVSARAVMAYYARPDGTFSASNGTSLSTPIISGMLACMWQANPGLSNTELYHATEVNSSLAGNHDDQMGYGIPDFVAVNNYLTVEEPAGNESLSEIGIYPNPYNGMFRVSFASEQEGPARLMIADMTGRMLLEKQLSVKAGENTARVDNAAALPSGIYFLRIELGKSVLNARIVKQ